MALQFQKQKIHCLRNIVSRVQNLEQTQELRLPEGLPGVGQIPGCWGQILIRSKEWSGDTVRLTGGVLIWLLYLPESEGDPERLESWIPFQMDFELPEGSREGWIRAKTLLRSCDARPVSAGKILIRAGIGVQVQCWSPEELVSFHPEGSDETVELLTERWPVLLAKEAGEKSVALEDVLTLPGSVPKPEKLLYYRMTAEITDKKVLGNKLVFRGAGKLHLLYQTADGQIANWDVELPFSQYAQLEDSYAPDARADLQMEVTALELSLDADGGLQLHGNLTAQYLIADRQMLETAADAYSPVQDLKLQHTCLDLLALLEERQETIRAERKIPVSADRILDAAFLPDFPRQHQEGDNRMLEFPGMIQLLWQDREGQLQGSNQRWEGNLSMKTDEKNHLLAVPGTAELQIQEMPEAVTVKAELPALMQSSSGSGITMVTDAQPGENRSMPENRPSLILCRAGGRTLWELARMNGSRVSLIQEANGLTGEPEAGRMLLIPVV